MKEIQKHIAPLLEEIGFSINPSNGSYQLYRYDDMLVKKMELFQYIKDTNGVYNLILQKTNFVPIRIEIKEGNEKLFYDFISNHFDKKYVRELKLKILKIK
jgi:hypothetical protein